MNAARTTIAFLSASMLAIGLAHGGIVYSPVNVSLSAYGGLTLDLNHDGTADFILGFAANNTARPYITNAVVTGFTNSVLSREREPGFAAHRRGHDHRCQLPKRAMGRLFQQERRRDYRGQLDCRRQR